MVSPEKRSYYFGVWPNNLSPEKANRLLRLTNWALQRSPWAVQGILLYDWDGRKSSAGGRTDSYRRVFYVELYFEKRVSVPTSERLRDVELRVDCFPWMSKNHFIMRTTRDRSETGRPWLPIIIFYIKEVTPIIGALEDLLAMTKQQPIRYIADYRGHLLPLQKYHCQSQVVWWCWIIQVPRAPSLFIRWWPWLYSNWCWRDSIWKVERCWAASLDFVDCYPWTSKNHFTTHTTHDRSETRQPWLLIIIFYIKEVTSIIGVLEYLVAITKQQPTCYIADYRGHLLPLQKYHCRSVMETVTRQ